MTASLLQRSAPLLRRGFGVLAGFAGIGALLFLGRSLAASLGQDELASRLPWYLSRAAGITAYLLLTAATVLGLAISTRVADRWLARPVVFALHEQLAWLGLAATGLHLGALLGDSYLPFRLDDLLVPFAAPYRPGAVALGVLALYLSAAITGSFYVRARIGQRAWRALHMASFATYALATVHGVLAGSSTAQPWMQWLYLASGVAVLFLTNYRLLLARRIPQSRPLAAPSRPQRSIRPGAEAGAAR
jgi:predicted ferric reductase